MSTTPVHFLDFHFYRNFLFTELQFLLPGPSFSIVRFTNRSNILRTLFYHSHTAFGSIIEFYMHPFHMNFITTSHSYMNPLIFFQVRTAIFLVAMFEFQDLNLVSKVMIKPNS